MASSHAPELGTGHDGGDPHTPGPAGHDGGDPHTPGPAGLEWLVDAYGCSPSALRGADQIGRVFSRAVEELGLCPIGPPRFHTFPDPGGVTGMLMLSESHLTCHTFPEHGFAAFNLYCCRARPDWPWEVRLAEILGAERVIVRRIERVMTVNEEGLR